MSINLYQNIFALMSYQLPRVTYIKLIVLKPKTVIKKAFTSTN